MQTFDRQTRRLYHEDMYLRRTTARIVRLGDDFIELDATVAYPDGGGQEADAGLITTENGTVLRFVGAKKLFGRMIFLTDFPNIQVEGIIRHMIHLDDVGRLQSLAVGQSVEVEIDVQRRAQLSLGHTASHLVYIGVGLVRPDAIPGTVGCHIKPGSARFDFSVQERFSQEQLSEITDAANRLVQRGIAVRLYAHAAEPDARYWECDGHVIPCGGTHIDNSRQVGQLVVRRKSLGAGKERITCEFPGAVYELDRYRG